MNCDKCGKEIGIVEEEEAYQVRIGYTEDNGEFCPSSEIGYYCSDCLSKGV